MSDFTEYLSKKRLEAANILTGEEFSLIDDIKYISTIHLHEQGRFAALTLYNENVDSKYSFLILDLKTKSKEAAGSIKLAKQAIRERVKSLQIHTPSCSLVDEYLQKWDGNPELSEPEAVLKKLFTEVYPANTSLYEIIVKAAALNTIYNTNIYSIYPMADHILSLNIDERLRSHDKTLVKDIMKVTYNKGKSGERDICHYSFATKYCSFHKPDAFPIFDSYVEKLLKYYRDNEHFASFKDSALRDYPAFKCIIKSFQKSYCLEKYSFKQIDQFLWLLGKEYFK